MAAMARTTPSWADAGIHRKKFDRNSVELPRYADIERRFKADGRALVRAYQAGDINQAQFIGQFRDKLQRAETDAFVAGRRARGVADPTISDDEAAMLDGRFSRNMKYAHKFARDISAGRGRMDYEKRVELYGNSLWSVYTRGETTDWSEPNKNARHHWILDPDAEHCNTCIQNAKESRERGGFTWEEMAVIGWPGEKTDCMTKCRCHIRVQNKRRVDPDRAMAQEVKETPEEGFDAYRELVGEDYTTAMAASGLPMVRTAPALIEEAEKMDSHAMALPVVPKTLMYPASVNVLDNDLRLFVGTDGVSAWVARDPDNGLWYVFSLILGKDAKLW